MKLLTITVPAYNVESTLQNTLDSLCLAETLDKLDIIVVDDGSKDRTAELALRYVSKHPGSVRLISKQNGGHGSAVNTGIANAVGKYFKVVDGDDRLDKHGFIALLKRLEQTDADLVAANYKKVSLKDGSVEDMSFEGVEFGSLYAFEELPKSDKIYFGIHSINIKTKILRQNEIRLQEHTFYVDVEYGLLPVPFIKTVEFFKETVYLYFVGGKGQSIDMTNFVNRYDDHYRVVKRMSEYLNSAVCSKRQHEYMLTVLGKICFTHYMLSAFYDKDKRRGKSRALEFDKWLKSANSEVYENLAGSVYIRTLRLFEFKVLPPVILSAAVKTAYDFIKPVFKKKRRFTY